MKNLIVLIGIVTIGLLTSCQKDELVKPTTVTTSKIDTNVFKVQFTGVSGDGGLLASQNVITPLGQVEGGYPTPITKDTVLNMKYKIGTPDSVLFSVIAFSNFNCTVFKNNKLIFSKNVVFGVGMDTTIVNK